MITFAPTWRLVSTSAVAALLVDFMVSPEGQSTVNRGLLSARNDVDGVLAAVVDAHQPDNSRLTPEAVAEYQERWRSLFQ